ncbi:hypothetical protein DPEC_G00307830 [Dallia pectoralis]|uniref:Uncharacterized protein n=1 Tax=Dallia pectoralis TaxID=75939 RepID=A0ACC2FEH7_DALPE|nr:hypothetical protein DPEC_G00307830 [Dallia pectoralis]
MTPLTGSLRIHTVAPFPEFPGTLLSIIWTGTNAHRFTCKPTPVKSDFIATDHTDFV